MTYPYPLTLAAIGFLFVPAIVQAQDCIDRVGELSQQLESIGVESDDKTDVVLKTVDGQATAEAKQSGSEDPPGSWFTSDEHGVSAAKERLQQARDHADAGNSQKCDLVLEEIEAALEHAGLN